MSGATAKPVERCTVKAVLDETALRRLGNGQYFFCPEPTCDIVYFDKSGAIFRTDDLRVPVWQKRAFGHRMICYCFDENEAAIRTEIEASGESAAVARVRAHIAAGRCACEVRNPQGVCCLGDLMAAVDRVRRALQIGAQSR